MNMNICLINILRLLSEYYYSDSRRSSRHLEALVFKLMSSYVKYSNFKFVVLTWFKVGWRCVRRRAQHWIESNETGADSNSSNRVKVMVTIGMFDFLWATIAPPRSVNGKLASQLGLEKMGTRTHMSFLSMMRSCDFFYCIGGRKPI